VRAAFECEVIKYDVIWSETEVECDTAADAWVGGLSLQHAAELEACRLRLQHWLAAWRSCSVVGPINQVTLRPAWLILGWASVTVFGPVYQLSM